jgi:hypothetical protein
MMMLLKLVSFFCVAALGIAFLGDCAIFACGRIFDSFAIAARPSGWVVILLTIWLAAFAIACSVIVRLHVFPFMGPK